MALDLQTQAPRKQSALSRSRRVRQLVARLLGAIVVGFLLVSASLARAEVSDVEVERQAEALSRSIMSPFCPGRTVSACPSPNAHEWRDDIRKWVREGVSADEIRNRLAARDPQHNLLGTPPNRLGWALPVGLTLASFGVLFLALRYVLRGRAPATEAVKGGAGKKAAESTPPPPGEDPEDWDAKLKQELDALEQ